MDVSVASSPPLPLEIVRRIADLVANTTDGRRRSTIALDVQNCSLVNLTFASAFQPHIFHRTYLTGMPDPRVQKRLDILLASPHLAAYVKHLTLTLNDAFVQSSLVLPSLLDRFTSLKSLTLAFFSCRIRWELLWSSFRASVKRLSELPTLETLNLNEVEGVPASLFMANRSLIGVSISGSSPVFDLSPAEDTITQDPSLPLSFNATDVDLAKFNVDDVFTRAKGFFSRTRSFSGTASWTPDKNTSFNTFVSLLAKTSRLERLEVTTDREYMNDGGMSQSRCFCPFPGFLNDFLMCV